MFTRNALADSREVPAGDEDGVLDAARETVMAVGVRRTTVSEVARRARLSRTTVYRRYPDGAALLRALMAREFAGVIARAEADAPQPPDSRAGLLGAIVRTADLLAANPVLVRLLEVDPELLLPYLTERGGRFQDHGRRVLAARIAAAQAAGAVRGGDAETMAAAIELALRGFVISARTLSRPARAAALHEIELMLDGYLARTPVQSSSSST